MKSSNNTHPHGGDTHIFTKFHVATRGGQTRRSLREIFEVQMKFSSHIARSRAGQPYLQQWLVATYTAAHQSMIQWCGNVREQHQSMIPW